jgi:HK97 family phage major capsid protein
MELIKELIDKRARLATEAGEILTRATKDGREGLNADEDTKHTALHAEIEALTKTIDTRQRQANIEKYLASPQERKVQPETRVVIPGAARAALDRDLALRGWLLGGTDKFTTEHVEAGQRMGRDIRNKFFTFNLARDPLQLRAAGDNQSVAENADGGYTVPNETMRALEDALLHFGGMRQVSTVIRTNSGAALPIPTSNDTDIEGDIVAENVVFDTHEGISFGQVVLHAFKYTSKPILASVELMQDSSINMGEFIGTKLGERIGRKQNRDFTVGGGTTLPWGLVDRSVAGVDHAGSVGAGIVYDDIIDLEHSVDVAYRGGAQYMFHDLTLAKLKKLRDDVGRPLWSAGLAVGAPNTISGYPYTINNHMASAVTDNFKVMLFGALSKYLVRDVREVTLVRLDELFALYGQVAFVAWARADGDLLDAGTNPVKHFSYQT